MYTTNQLAEAAIRGFTDNTTGDRFRLNPETGRWEKGVVYQDDDDFDDAYEDDDDDVLVVPSATEMIVNERREAWAANELRKPTANRGRTVTPDDDDDDVLQTPTIQW